MEILYLTTLECPEGHEHSYAHEGQWIQPMQEAPWPDVERCPKCGSEYPDDLGVALVEEAEIERVPNPEIPPEER